MAGRPTQVRVGEQTAPPPGAGGSDSAVSVVGARATGLAFYTTWCGTSTHIRERTDGTTTPADRSDAPSGPGESGGDLPKPERGHRLYQRHSVPGGRRHRMERGIRWGVPRSPLDARRAARDPRGPIVVLWGAAYHLEVWNRVRRCFAVDDETYADTVDPALEQVYGVRRIVTEFLVAVGAVFVWNLSLRNPIPYAIWFERYEPTEYDQNHLDGTGLDVTTGLESVAQALEEEGLSYSDRDHATRSNSDHHGSRSTYRPDTRKTSGVHRRSALPRLPGPPREGTRRVVGGERRHLGASGLRPRTRSARAPSAYTETFTYSPTRNASPALNSTPVVPLTPPNSPTKR